MLDKETISMRLAALRKKMSEEGLSMYIAVSSDFHQSHDICKYFRFVEYLSGIDCIDGEMAVTEEHALLFTDDEIKEEELTVLEEAGIEVHNGDDPDDMIPNIMTYLHGVEESMQQEVIAEAIEGGMVRPLPVKYMIGFDARTVSPVFMRAIADAMEVTMGTGAIRMDPYTDLAGDVWKNRPSLPKESVLHVENNGYRTPAQKLAELRANWDEETAMVTSSSADVAWLFNLMGADAPFSLGILSYAFIDRENAYLFIDRTRVEEETAEHLKKNGITLRDYDEFYAFMEHEAAGEVFYDESKCNAAIAMMLGKNNSVSKITTTNDFSVFRMIKTEEEINWAFTAETNQALITVRFMKWFRENVDKTKMTCRSAEEHIDLLYDESEALSHARVPVCYFIKSRTESEGVTPIKPIDIDERIEGDGFLTIMCGSYFPFGSSDVRRTISIGEPSQTEAFEYTAVISALMKQLDSNIVPGISDDQLSVMVQERAWYWYIDTPRSAVFGMGDMINIWDDPCGFGSVPMENGICLSLALASLHDDLLEKSQAISVSLEEFADDWNFLRMSRLSSVPIDTRPIIADMLTDEELKRLNTYNKECYTTLKPYLNAEEAEWLKKETAPIKRKNMKCFGTKYRFG